MLLCAKEGGGNEGGMALTSCFSTARRASPENILVSEQEVGKGTSCTGCNFERWT